MQRRNMTQHYSLRLIELANFGSCLTLLEWHLLPFELHLLLMVLHTLELPLMVCISKVDRLDFVPVHTLEVLMMGMVLTALMMHRMGEEQVELGRNKLLSQNKVVLQVEPLY